MNKRLFLPICAYGMTNELCCAHFGRQIYTPRSLQTYISVYISFSAHFSADMAYFSHLHDYSSLYEVNFFISKTSKTRLKFCMKSQRHVTHSAHSEAIGLCVTDCSTLQKE